MKNRSPEHNYRVGFLTGIVLGCIFASMVISVINNLKLEDVKSKFEVVDNYKGCDVVRYESLSLSRSQFFLHCPK